MAHHFRCDQADLQIKYDAALEGLKKNTVLVGDFPEKVLIEGGMYTGIWLECGPHESTVYKIVDPQVTFSSHRIFYSKQHEDGCFTAAIQYHRAFAGMIQMVVPIASTALETALYTQNEKFLEESYNACAKWDRWLSTYRNTRKTGLCEMFCEWDTGHDQSPRLNGLPRECPEGNARLCHDLDILPYLAPDLSATVYGGRTALARMARLLGKDAEAAVWEEKAEEIRRAILAYCFDGETLCFYDLNAKNRFVRIVGDILTRVLSEHVVDQSLFELIFKRHIINPEEFWTPYPLPSIAINDPMFDKNLPENSWGGASQALAALRTPRWMNYYKKPSWHTILMEKWVGALVKAPDFMQQMNPWTGEFSTSAGYSPAMCVMLDFIPRLYGVRWEDGELEWNCAMPQGASSCSYSVDAPAGTAEIARSGNVSTARLAGRLLFQAEGTGRIITDNQGTILRLVGTRQEKQTITVTMGEAIRSVVLEPDAELKFEPKS